MVKIKDIMKKYVVTVNPELTLSDAAKIMTNNRIGSVVVTQKNKPIGIVTNEDIVKVVAEGRSPKNVKISDMKPVRKLVTVAPEDDMLKVTRMMIKKGVKRLPVLKDGKLVGIVSEKEILLVSPELINILSEKLKDRVERVAKPTEIISGICETCESYSDDLKNIAGRWICETCRD
ncbi:MAG: CBS domain-containing protein [Nanoarchaeota archaeon]|nr:CBS domain-containing protein [Nanoarchaeota archaeon]MBU1135299.1 CBS domain-containing protein [Nanoarchaeota archaeon]